MDEKKNILLQLNTFKNLNKFSNSAWNKRGLNPSDNDICERLERLFNKSADSLIEAINSDYSTRQLKNVLENNLKNFKRSDYDTEECEFICDYFFQLSEIVSVDFKDNLNGWLYGRILSTLLRITAFIKRDDRIIETLSQNCTKCHTELKTYIIKKEEGIVATVEKTPFAVSAEKNPKDSDNYNEYVLIHKMNKPTSFEINNVKFNLLAKFN